MGTILLVNSLTTKVGQIDPKKNCFFLLRPLQVVFLFLVSNFPKSGEGKREIRNLETFLLPVSGQPVTRQTIHTAVD